MQCAKPVEFLTSRNCLKTDFGLILSKNPVNIPVAVTHNIKFATTVLPKGNRVDQRKTADAGRKQLRSDVLEIRYGMPVVTEGPDFAREISAVRTERIPENI